MVYISATEFAIEQAAAALWSPQWLLGAAAVVAVLVGCLYWRAAHDGLDAVGVLQDAGTFGLGVWLFFVCGYLTAISLASLLSFASEWIGVDYFMGARLFLPAAALAAAAYVFLAPAAIWGGMSVFGRQQMLMVALIATLAALLV